MESNQKAIGKRFFVKGMWLAFACFLFQSMVAFSQTVLVPWGSVWKYRDTGEDLGTQWMRMDYPDQEWPSGRAELGYGDGDEATVIGYGPDPQHKYPTTYFRHAFWIHSPGDILALDLLLKRDDGALVYLNGVEVARSNLPEGPIRYTTYALEPIMDQEENITLQFSIDSSLLRMGENLLAVEIHQCNATSSDLSFDLELRATDRPSGGDLPLWINEVMASNISWITDPEFNQFADWIELYHAGATPLSLAGYGLTDDPRDPFRWRFPAGTQIPPGGYLLVWADGIGQGLHTNFKLDADGETLTLFAPSGMAIASVSWKTQVSDVSYGRMPDGSDHWRYFPNPTPGAPNGIDGLPTRDQADMVRFSPEGGLFFGPVTVTLSCPDPEAVVRYTTNGSLPDLHAPRYEAPIRIEKTAVIRARAFRPDRLPGPIETRSFVIGETGSLPILSLSVDPSYLWDDGLGIWVDRDIAARKAWERPATLDFFEPGGQGGFQSEGKIRLFGNTAYYLPQKSLAFFADRPIPYSLFPDRDLPYYASFVLRSSSDDWHLTLFRDGLIHLLARPSLRLDVQAFRPATVLINGEYFGIYNLREKYNASYFLTHYGIDPSNLDLLYLDERQADPVTVLDGDRIAYDSMISFLTNNDPADPSVYARIPAYLDLDSLIDFVILQALIGNQSWAHNIRIWRTRSPESPFRFALFDCDRGFRPETSNLNVLQDMINRFFILRRIWQNPTFRTRLSERLTFLVNFVLTPERAEILADSLAGLIQAEMPRHIARWKDHCGNGVCGIPSMTAWQGAIDDLKRVARLRHPLVFTHLSQAIGKPLVRVRVTPSPNGGGKVKLGDGLIETEFQGTYVKGDRLSLKAIPADGFLFREWQGLSVVSELLIAQGAVWKYWDKGTDLPPAWRDRGYDDTSWKEGAAELGYGDGDETTVVSYGPDATHKFITTYFRKTFTVTDPGRYTSLKIRIRRDDGALVFLNGTEVFRSNLPEGSITPNTPSLSAVNGEDERTWYETRCAASCLRAGENVIAVEVHQSSPTSSDLSFDLILEGELPGGTIPISLGPELILTLEEDASIEARFEPDGTHRLPSEIHGHIRLTRSGSPYHATGSVTIHEEGILEAEPGVEIRMPQAAHLDVRGGLTFDGTSDLPIRLTGETTEPWGAIIGHPGSRLVMRHVVIGGGSTGSDPAIHPAALNVIGADITLEQVTITPKAQPFYARESRVVLRNSLLDGKRAGDDIVSIVGGSALIEGTTCIGDGEVDLDLVDGAVIRNNVIRIMSQDPNRDGIDIGGSKSVSIEGNRIEDASDKGISIGEASDAVIRGNVIVRCGTSIAVKDGSNAKIDRNTCHLAQIGVHSFEKTKGLGGGTACITNTIFSAIPVPLLVDDRSHLTASYCLADQAFLEGPGHLSADPAFVDPLASDFRLKPNSPCIDAGNPESDPDPDGSRADIGAFPFVHPGIAYAGLRLNEIMAANHSTLRDEFGDADDWIEIHHLGPDPVDLAGLYLSDSPAHPDRWPIPTGRPDKTSIQPGGFLILWCDGEPHEGPTHLGFRLSAEGERLLLSAQMGSEWVILDSVSFGRLPPDVSWGRLPDGSGAWQVMNRATPGRSNRVDTRFRLLSPLDGFTFCPTTDTLLTFRWTAYRPPDGEDRTTGYLFRIQDQENVIRLATFRSDTSLSLQFHPAWQGTFSWSVTAKTAHGDSLPMGPSTIMIRCNGVDPQAQLPRHFVFYPTHPNPFNPETTLRFDLPSETEVTLIVYDLLGTRIKTLWSGILPAGSHSTLWDGRDDEGRPVPSGIYFCRMEAGPFRAVRKMILMR